MKIITVGSLNKLIKRHGFDNYMMDLMKALKRDFKNWHLFTKIPRPAMHVPGGVLELMPICDNKKYYSFKYVNCHPKNPLTGKMTVVATGQLSRIDTGYPLMFSEIRYFDIDSKAMDKFEKNMEGKPFKLVRCKNAKEATEGADIITVCTACKAHVDVIKNDWIKAGMHINALGGDTIGKTELELSILDRCKIVVEYFEQCVIEGEIQRLTKGEAKQLVHAELFELVNGSKNGRENDKEITLF